MSRVRTTAIVAKGLGRLVFLLSSTLFDADATLDRALRDRSQHDLVTK
jgi:hypothetical protein